MIVLFGLLIVICAVAWGYVIGWHAGQEAARDDARADVVGFGPVAARAVLDQAVPDMATFAKAAP